MSLASDAVKGFALAHALPVVGLLFGLSVLAWGGYEWRVRSAYHDGYKTGAAVIRDSAKVATKRILARSESTYNHRADSLARLAIAVTPLPRRDPPAPQVRIEPLDDSLVPTVTISRDRFVSVYVKPLQHSYIAEKPLADAFYQEDTTVHRHLIPERDSLRTAVVYWRKAFFAKDTTRLLADSISSPALQPSAPPAKPSWKRTAATAAALLTLGAVLHNNIRIR